jgi:hypothetical protein
MLAREADRSRLKIARETVQRLGFVVQAKALWVIAVESSDFSAELADSITKHDFRRGRDMLCLLALEV